MPQGIGAGVRTCPGVLHANITYFSHLLQSRLRTATINVRLQDIIGLVMYYLGVKCAHINNLNIIRCIYDNIA